jgi:hypothetical protein
MFRAARQRLVLTAVLFVVAVGPALAQTEKVYVTRTGTKYHRASCSSLRSSKIEMPLVDAAVRYGPCAICRPPLPTAGATPASAPTPSTVRQAVAEPVGVPSTSTPVLITRTGTKYHREGCRTLRNGGIPSTLGEASRRYGPCAVCKPPGLTTPAAPATMGVTPTAPPAPAARSTRCQATTKKGMQCSRNAKPGSSYCWQHGG